MRNWKLSAHAMLLVLSISFGQYSVAQTTEEPNASAKLQAFLQAMKSYSAEFSQVVYDEQGQVLQESSGYAQVQRPGKMYWRVAEPFQSLTVSKDSLIWHYDIDLEQVSRSELAEDMSQAPALLLGDDAQALQEHFYVEMIGETGRGFALSPKAESGVFSRLEFHFDKRSLLSDMVIVDSLQQRTAIRFSDAESNPELDQSLFDFVVPDGVDLIDNGL